MYDVWNVKNEIVNSITKINLVLYFFMALLKKSCFLVFHFSIFFYTNYLLLENRKYESV